MRNVESQVIFKSISNILTWNKNFVNISIVFQCYYDLQELKKIINKNSQKIKTSLDYRCDLGF